MKKYLVIILATVLISVGIAHADTIGTISQWLINQTGGNSLYPRVTPSTTKIIIGSNASTNNNILQVTGSTSISSLIGAPCIGADASGTLISTACGTTSQWVDDANGIQYGLSPAGNVGIGIASNATDKLTIDLGSINVIQPYGYKLGYVNAVFADLANINWFLGNSGNTSAIGANNYCFGNTACANLGTGDSNIGIGSLALNAIAKGANNVGIGYLAGQLLTDGFTNIFVGALAGSNTESKINNNVGVGASSLINSESDENTCVGNSCGSSVTTQDNITLLGSNSDATVRATTNSGCVGANCIVNAPNAFIIGDSAVSVGIGTTTPAAKLHVLGTTEQLRLAYDAGNYTSFTTGATGNLTIAPSGATTTIAGRLAVTGTTTLAVSSGYVGIGTTTPAAMLQVWGRAGDTANVFQVVTSTGVNLFKVDSTGAGTFSSNLSAANLLANNILRGTTIDSNLAVATAGNGLTYTWLNNGSKTNTSGNSSMIKIAPIYNQTATSTAANSDLLIQRTETSISTSGLQYLIQAGTSTAPNLFTVNNKGAVTMTSINTISFGNAVLLAGACTSTVSTYVGATTTSKFITTPQTWPGDGTFFTTYNTAQDQVTTKVCAIVALTPTASIFNIQMIK